MNPEKRYYPNGRIKSENWRNEAGEDHRLDGPAHRWWYKNGRLESEVWYKNNLFHRLDGLAYQCWFTNGRVKSEGWYINGVKYETKDEFQAAVDLYKANEIAELF